MSGIINHCHKKIKNLTVKLQSTQKETILELASIIIIFYDVTAKFPIKALVWSKTWTWHCEDRIQSMGKTDWQLITWSKNRRTAPHFKANNDGASLCFRAEARWGVIPFLIQFGNTSSSAYKMWFKTSSSFPRLKYTKIALCKDLKFIKCWRLYQSFCNEHFSNAVNLGGFSPSVQLHVGWSCCTTLSMQ